MRMIYATLRRYWLHALALFIISSVANAAGNFVLVSLPKGVTVELPRNWSVLSNNQRITIDSYVQAKRELSGAIDPSSDLGFAANYYDELGKTAVIFNIRYYPEQTVTQTMSRAATTSDTKDIDDAIHSGVVESQQQFGVQLLSWSGTTKQAINGTVAFVTEYRRAGYRDSAPFRVRLVRVLNAGRSFTVTVSYREDQEHLLEPICDRVIQSIHT
jgi:hypothetical protein